MGLLKKSYRLISAILMAVIIIYFSTTNLDLKSFSLNLVTEILGIFITVFLIDYVIQEREKKEKTKILKSAFHQFKRPVNDILHLFVEIYKATCEFKPQNLNTNYKEILSTEEFYETIKLFDYVKNAPIFPTRTWASYISFNVQSLKDTFDKIIDKYAFVLDSTIITEMELISSSPFLQIFASGEIILHADISINTKRTSLNILATETLMDDLKLFLEKVYYINDYFGKQVQEDFSLKYDLGIWQDNMVPKIGTARVNQKYQKPS
ncbi:hypothetical protein ACNQGB_01980 [Flavobacterium sp. XS1P32]|uniref:hypothetical protein n=1 Tax=Flavobacterium sp. XS1P32 TaxID=3401726 RepID=UPI003AAEBB17